MNYAYNPNPAPVSAPRKSVSACGVVGFILAVLTFVFYIVGSLATEGGFLAVIESFDLDFEVFAGSLFLLISTVVLFGTSFAAIKGNTAVPAIAGIFYFIAMLFNQLYVFELDVLEWIFEYSIGQTLVLLGLVLAFLIGVCFLFFAKNLGCKIVSAIMFAAVLLVPLFVKDNFFGPSVTELGIVSNWWSGESFDFGTLLYQLSVCVLPYAAFLMIALGGKKQNSSKPQQFYVPQPQQIPYGVPQQPNVYGVPQTQQNVYGVPAVEPAAPVADPVEPLEQPAPAPVAEPIAVPTEQPAYEPTAAPTVELTPELKPEPTAEPASESAPEPVADPVVQQTPQFVMTEEKAAKLRVLFAKKTNGEITEEQFKELRNELFK